MNNVSVMHAGQSTANHSAKTLGFIAITQSTESIPEGLSANDFLQVNTVLFVVNEEDSRTCNPSLTAAKKGSHFLVRAPLGQKSIQCFVSIRFVEALFHNSGLPTERGPVKASFCSLLQELHCHELSKTEQQDSVQVKIQLGEAIKPNIFKTIFTTSKQKKK
eukprot:scpid96508/ scgid20655/ 